MRYINALLFSLIMLSLPALYRDLSCGFRLHKLLIPDRGKGPAATEEAIATLMQDFTYLGQGTQSYVFESRDGKYVLKLFRFEQTQNPIYRFIRGTIRGKPPRLNFEKQRERLFRGCRIAETFLREETALALVHLEAGERVWPAVKLHLPLMRSCEVKLDDYCFAIQEKGERIYPSLLSSFNDPEQMKRKLDSFHALLKSRAGKGIANLDSDLHRNFGFVGEKAIEIDFGAYHLVSGDEAQKEVGRFSAPLRSWLLKRSEEWLLYWDSVTKG